MIEMTAMASLTSADALERPTGVFQQVVLGLVGPEQGNQLRDGSRLPYHAMTNVAPSVHVLSRPQ